MTKTVEFLFDVGSPYSYLAYHQLPKVAAAQQATVVWTPVLLGGIFQATGNRSPAETPAKSAHLHTDLQRWAQHFGVGFAMNPHFPINTLTLMRAAVGLQLRDAALFHRYLAAVFAAMFEVPQNLGDPAILRTMLAAADLDPDLVLLASTTPEAKERLKANTVGAVARGVFGAPSFFVGDQLFWGQDRLHFVEAALA